MLFVAPVGNHFTRCACVPAKKTGVPLRSFPCDRCVHFGKDFGVVSMHTPNPLTPNLKHDMEMRGV